MNETQLIGANMALETFIRFLWRELLHYSTDKEKTYTRAKQAAQDITEQNTARLAEKQDYTPTERLALLEGISMARKCFLDIVSRDETPGDRSF